MEISIETIFWGIIAFVYFSLLVVQLNFVLYRLPSLANVTATIIIEDMNSNVNQVNQVTDYIFKLVKKTNKIQLLGYSAAFVAALLATILTII